MKSIVSVVSCCYVFYNGKITLKHIFFFFIFCFLNLFNVQVACIIVTIHSIGITFVQQSTVIIIIIIKRVYVCVWFFFSFSMWKSHAQKKRTRSNRQKSTITDNLNNLYDMSFIYGVNGITMLTIYMYVLKVFVLYFFLFYIFFFFH